MKKSLKLLLSCAFLFIFVACSSDGAPSSSEQSPTITNEGDVIDIQQLDSEADIEDEARGEAVDTQVFQSDELHIGFKYHPDWHSKNLKQSGNKVVSAIDPSIHYLEIFTKESSQSIKSAIFDVIKAQDKNIQKCRLVSGRLFDNGLQEYFLDISDTTVYSAEERKKLQEATDNPQGVVDRAWVEKAIYQANLEELCSIYAQTNEPSTCKGTRAKFYYNPQQSRTKFIFAPPQVCDPSFYEYGSFEFF